jgi:hypothetical protein
MRIISKRETRVAREKENSRSSTEYSCGHLSLNFNPENAAARRWKEHIAECLRRVEAGA